MLWPIAVILMVLWFCEGWCDRKTAAKVSARHAER